MNIDSEEWKLVIIENHISANKEFEISNWGRIIAYSKDKKEGQLMIPSSIRGYKCLTIVQTNRKTTTRYIHKLVAQAFIDNPDENKKCVIHLDHDRSNNHMNNLAWATYKEKEKHARAHNPKLKDYSKPRNAKLTEKHVKIIKRRLNDPSNKTRMKIIAKQYGISEMQLYRIKAGINWAHVT